MLRNTQWPFSAYIPEHYNNILYVYQDLEMVEISHFAGALTGTSTCVAVALFHCSLHIADVQLNNF